MMFLVKQLLRQGHRFIKTILIITLIIVLIISSKYCDIEMDLYKRTPAKFNTSFLTTFDLVTPESNQPIDHSTTVVSIYFLFKRSKHKTVLYDQWTGHMAASVSSPLVLIVNPSAYQKLKPLRLGKLTRFYIVESIWHIMAELELDRGKSYQNEYLYMQRWKDPEYRIHNPDLYAVWNLKSYITHKVAQENPFNSSFFIYTDAGAFRAGKALPDWPNTEFISQKLAPYLNDRILFGQIDACLKFNELKDIIEGTFFAGSQNAVSDFYEHHFEIHDSRMRRGLFVGKDQTMMNLLALRYFDQSVVRLKAFGLKCNLTYNPWNFYQYYLSRDPVHKCDSVENELSILEDSAMKPCLL
jgi:hypothetical protein